MKPTWKIKTVDEETQCEFSRVLGLNKNLASILIAKGKNNLIDAYHFLNPKLSSLNSPYLMKGMSEAVKRIKDAISQGEKIAIFADSDLDGLTSLTILLNLFERFGVEPYCRYAVEDEDYGLRMEVIEELRNNGVGLLITLDCGIRDVKEISYARELGIDVIVCDHHEQGEDLPDAIIVNPKQRDCAYPFKELAGVGVAFKLCHGILLSYLQSYNRLFLLIVKEADGVHLNYIKNGIIEKTDSLSGMDQLVELSRELGEVDNIVYYNIDNDKELVTSLFTGKNIYDLNSLIGSFLKKEKYTKNNTLDDLCDIFSINRNIIKKSNDIASMVFAEIEYSHSPKIREFIDSTIDLVSLGTIADIMPVEEENRIIVHHGVKAINTTRHPGLSIIVKRISNKVTSKNVAWDISPLLNTPGRFGKTDLTASFFIEKEKRNLESILDEINNLNDKRKRLVTDLMNNILYDIENGAVEVDKNLLWIESSEIPEGLTGLLANRLAETLGKPVIVVSLNGNKEVVKGSGRTTGDFNFFSFVEPLSSFFTKIGGHPKAFGFSANKEKLETIRERIDFSIGDNFKYSDWCDIDLEIPIEIITLDFINSLSLFEPYGHQNEECIFLTRDADLKGFKRFGSDMNHGKYTFKQNRSIEAIGWNMAHLMEGIFEKKRVDILYKLEINRYNGRTCPRMIILDLD